MMRKFLSGGLLVTLLLVLAACGGPGPVTKAPDPPSLVTVTPGPNVLHVSWVHDGQRAKKFIVYREPRDGSATKAEIARVPKNDHDGVAFSYMDTTASDESKVLYSVAAVGPGGASQATVQTDGVPTGGLAVQPKTCQVHQPTATDSDGDGISNTQETTGWTFTLFEGTATRSGINGKYQQNFTTSTVKSDPHNPDTDGDGLCDLQEMMHRTNPTAADSDEDGLTDLAELGTWVSDPNNVDTDLDSFNPIIVVKDNKESIDDLGQASGNSDLWDGNEVNTYHTSPTLFDSDGDTYSDYNEIVVRGSTFGPLISDLPAIELSLVGATDLEVNIAYSDSSKKAQTKTASLATGQSASHTDSSSTTQKEWASVSDTVKTSVSANALGGSVSASNSLTVAGGFSHVQNNGWSKTSKQSSQNTYSDATTTAREQGRTISGGEIGIAVDAKNTGDVTFTLTKLAVTALQRDPDDPTTFRPLGTLDLSSSLKSGVNLSPGASAGPLDATVDLTAGNTILDLMADPSSLMFAVAYFSLGNESGLSYSFMDETTDARTVFFTIDYGNGDVVRAHVASNVKRKDGQIVGVSLKDALGILGINYKTAKITDKSGKSYTVLTQLYDNAAAEWVAVNQTTHKFWTTVVSGGKTAPITQDFDDITLQAGQNAFLLYVTDQDGDGLFLRDESLVGTSDTNKDTDGDGLNDYDEVRTGWSVSANLPPLFPAHVYSNPTLPDADHDGYSDSKEKSLGTDPNNPDTDGDLLCDGDGNSVNATGICTKGVTPDPKPLVPRFVFFPQTSSPQPYSIITPQGPININTNFSVPVTASSTFSARSLTTGPIANNTFGFSNGGRTLTMKNGEWFIPGAEIVVSLSNIKHEATGKILPVYQYRFRVKTNAAGKFPASFSSHQTVSVSMRSIVAGDFNQDALTDLAFVGAVGSVSKVGVMLQNSTGWDAPAYYQVSSGTEAEGLVAGDFNNDGRLDLAVGTPDTDKIAVLLAGSTRGAFNNPVSYDVGGRTSSLATADFNADGNLDLVTANYIYTTGYSSSVLLGGGNGAFKPFTEPPSSDETVEAVTTGDVNGDGIPDLITAVNPPGVFVALGNGDGAFRPTGHTQPFTAARAPFSIATGDFNGDGWLDVVTANLYSNDVSLLLNDGKGDGVFTPQPNTPVSAMPGAVITADFNGDGKLDIATPSRTAGVVTVLYGTNNVGVFDRQDVSGAGGGGLAAALVNTPSTSANNAPLTLIVASFGSLGFVTPTP